MYRTLDDFRAAKRRARQERDANKEALEGSLAALQDPGMRGVLLRDAAGDVLRSWGPYRKVSDLLRGRVSGSTVYAAGMAIASAQRSLKKRLIISGVSMLLSKMIGNEKSDGPGVLSSVASVIGDFTRGMRERKAARERARAEEEPSPIDVA